MCFIISPRQTKLRHQVVYKVMRRDSSGQLRSVTYESTSDVGATLARDHGVTSRGYDGSKSRTSAHGIYVYLTEKRARRELWAPERVLVKCRVLQRDFIHHGPLNKLGKPSVATYEKVVLEKILGR